jgi:F-type H+-transporting ATPase subunit a
LIDYHPDAPLWEWGFVRLNATILYTWLVMGLLVSSSWLATRRLSTGPSPSWWQLLLEILVLGMAKQIRDVAQRPAEPFLPFVGTLFVFIATANLLAVVPGYYPPTASLSTATALAMCVFLAVPVYGIAAEGVRGYLAHYVKPTVFMLPFNVLGELSRTLALAVRLFGNVMSGAKIAAILLALIPFVFPVVMHLLGMLTGLIQAYIFAILAIVYIASAVEARAEPSPPSKEA